MEYIATILGKFYKQTVFFFSKHFTFSNCFDLKFSKKKTLTKRKKKSLNIIDIKSIYTQMKKFLN